MNTIRTYIILLLVSAFFFSPMASGQTKAKKNKTDLTIEVVASDGTPIGYSEVVSSKNRSTYVTDENGKITLSVQRGDVVTIDAQGYDAKVVNLSGIADKSISVTLDERHLYEDDDHVLYNASGDPVSALRTVGAYSQVKGEDLEINPTQSILDALSGKLNGFYYMNSSTEPGVISWSGFVRAPNGGTPIIMVDGVERDIDYLEPEMIESVQLLKDASLKALYGGTQTNGIIMVKTKRGEAYKNRVRVNVSSGVGLAQRVPEFLNARDYATMYNKALENVGAAPVFDPSKYDGTNPVAYPDVDWYDYTLRNFTNVTRANAQASGGNRNTKYFLHLGFQDQKGLEKHTEYPNSNQLLSLRGNIDNTIFDFITFRLALNAAIQTKKWPNTTASSLMGTLSNLRPNEFPVTIPGELVGSDEEYLLGGSSIYRSNPLGMLTRNGFVEREYSYLQSDFSILFDFNRWIKGLTIQPSFTFDFYNEFSSKKSGGYAVYEPIVDAEGKITTVKWNKDVPVTALSKGAISASRNMHFKTNITYDRSFGKHDLTVAGLFLMQSMEYDSQLHKVKRLNSSVYANYMYDKRYVVDATLSYIGSPSFSKQMRFGLFPTVGLGWVISEESFMDSAEWLGYLKLRGSYGILGSTLYASNRIVSNYYYSDKWTVGGTYPGTSFNNIVTASQTGNPYATFQKSNELNIGFDFAMFNNSLSGSIGWFNNLFTGGLTNMSAFAAGVTGKNATLKFENYTSFMSTGVEADLRYDKRFGDFELSVAGNVAYAYSQALKRNELNYPDEFAGLRSDVRMGDILGYRYIGTFASEEDIKNSPVQALSEIYPGDFKYADENGDGIVDEEDRRVIGNSQPSIQYGLSVDLRYKGFNVGVYGYGLAGFDRVLNGKYYQNYGTRKYSKVLVNGLPNGNPHPTVRATNTVNNFQNSEYWLIDGGFFKIRNVEVGYTFPQKWTSKIAITDLKLFFRGANLATISKIKEVDPENMSAGIDSYPSFMTLTGGLSFSF